MKSPRAPLFLERQTYRRRRLMDAARILPVLGFVLILLPVLWSGSGDPASGGIGTAAEAVYLFGLWLVLILAAALLSRALRAALRREGGDAPRPPAEDADIGGGPAAP